MTSSKVSKENLLKVENFFVTTAKSIGSKRVEATVQDIADGSRVALATAHKALKELSERGIIHVIKPSSRRFPITYIYNGDISGFEMAQSKEDQISYLQNIIAEQKREISFLHEKVERLERMAQNAVL